MPKKQDTTVSQVLEELMSFVGVFANIFYPPKYFPRDRKKYTGNYSTYRAAVYNLQRRGCLKIIYKNGQRFLKLTKKGELEALMAKIRTNTEEKAWDGKWRLIVFDIPEQAREKRDKLRFLLKKAGFKKLQASVFISPYALNRVAVSYLKQTGLIAFIRMLKVEEIDDDKDLKKQFKIN